MPTRRPLREALSLGQTPARHRSDAIALATLFVAVAAYFWPWLTLRRVFYQVDLAFMDHPLRFHAFGLLRSGRFPFWSDALLAGFPLFAEGQAGILYPFSWLYFVLPPEAALNAFLILHFAILGVCSHLFLRSRGLSAASALFGSGSIVFSSFMLVEHVVPCFLATVSWLPLLLWLCERQARTRRSSHLAWAALPVALMHVAGDPFGTLLSLILTAAYVLFGVRDAAWRARLGAALLPVLLGGMLAGAQLLPTLEFLQHSTRRLGAAVSQDRFVPLEFLLTAFSPNYFGDSFAAYAAGSRQVWEEGLFFFVGWAPLLLVPFGLLRQRDRLFWLSAAGVGVLISSRSCFPVTEPLWSHPPLGLFRWPGRAMLWYAFALSILSAHGFDALLRRSLTTSQLTRRWWAACLLAAGAAGLLLGFHSSFVEPATSPSAFAALLRARHRDLLWLSANALLLLAATRLGFRRHAGRAALATLLFASLCCGVLVEQKPDGVLPEVYRREPEAARFLKRRFGSDARILALAPWSYPSYPTDGESLGRRAAALPANLHLRYGLKAIGQFDLEATTTLARNHALLAQPSPSVLDLLAVDALVGPAPPGDHRKVAAPFLRPTAGRNEEGFRSCHAGEARVYCRERRLARAFLVEDYRVLASGEECLRLMQSAPADLRRLVLLERQPTWEHLPATPPADRQRVTLQRDEPGLVELGVATPRDAILVLADSYYPGWTASLDGRPTEVLVADGFVRAVAVSAGVHQVSFRYRPRSFWLGLAASSLGLLAAAALLAGRRWIRPAAPPTPRLTPRL